MKRRAIDALAGGLPLLAYAVTTSAHGYWLDSGEFVAASIDLGIAHPPGQPLTALVGRVFCMLPVGPLAFRVALASAFMAALAALVLRRTIEATLHSVGLHSRRLTLPLSLGAAWSAAFAPGFWLQAVRPEVYALQAALGCLALERLTRLHSRWPTRDLRALSSATFALGLGLANHHLLGLVVACAALPMILAVARTAGASALLKPASFGLLGLGTYLYLPLRAAAAPTPNLGDPDSIARFAWVVSAQAFRKNTGAGVPQPLWERFADVLVQLGDNMHVACPLALAGIYSLLRMPKTRRLGAIWTTLLIALVAARAWLGFVRSNPDALGYLMLALAGLAAGAAAFVAALLVTLERRKRTRAPSVPTRDPPSKTNTRASLRTTTVCVGLMVVVGVCLIGRGAGRASLRSFDAADAFDDALWRDLPPRALVFGHAPQTIFRLWSLQAEQHARPDALLVPLPFATYPHMAEDLLARAPELRALLRSYLFDGSLEQAGLQSLAALRPVHVEMDVRVPPPLYRTLLPARLYFEVLADGATRADERAAARTQLRYYEQLNRRLEKQRHEPATRALLLWHYYNAALYYAGFGDPASAQAALALALEIEPLERHLRELKRVVDEGQLGNPADLSPFRRLDLRQR